MGRVDRKAPTSSFSTRAKAAARMGAAGLWVWSHVKHAVYQDHRIAVDSPLQHTVDGQGRVF